VTFPTIASSVPLQAHNTFGIASLAEHFIEIGTRAHLVQLAIANAPKPWRVLGGGSNVLLEETTSGTVLKNRITGIELIAETDESVKLKVGSGEIWHDLVMFAVGKGWGGLENLALIPGTVGAAPIQNIGAYGVEVKDTITEVEVWLWEENRFATISNEAAHFGYRDSIFKQQLRDKFFVVSVCFSLRKQAVLHTEYGAIGAELHAMGAVPSLANIAQAVMNIRRSKLPDPKVVGNAGSFFKNPSVQNSVFDALKKAYPELPGYPSNIGSNTKIPAAWLIEQCGWKGFRRGNVGVHDRQALVLVNYGEATGAEIWQLSEDILQSVFDTFGVLLEREVQVWSH